jgi:hypothetical protein
MIQATAQKQIAPNAWGDLGQSIKNIASNFVGRQHAVNEVSAAAAHWDGLIDCIERAGWDISRLEQVRHAFDTAAQGLLNELVDSCPDMSTAEQQSFLAPFHAAIHRFAGMTAREKLALRSEYERFIELREQSLKELVPQESA